MMTIGITRTIIATRWSTEPIRTVTGECMAYFTLAMLPTRRQNDCEFKASAPAKFIAKPSLFALRLSARTTNWLSRKRVVGAL